MRSSELIPLLLIVLGVATLYVSAAGILVRGLLGVLTRRPRRTASAARKWLRRVVVGLAGVAAVCMAYAYFIEPDWLEVTHVHITSDKLPPGGGPIRIVHVSDLHCDAGARLDEALPGVVAGEKPDIIVFTGDALNSRDGAERFRRCMRRLSQIAPTFAVKGNWDVWYHADVDLFGGTGVGELDDGAAELRLGGAKVWIGGLAPGRADGRIAELLAAAPDDALKVFLYHYPGQIYDAAGRADLYCCGHTHGGQVALPFYGAVVTLAKYGKRFEAGLYEVGGTQMYVNRGLGMEGRSVLRMRFLARPEVTVIHVAPATEPPPARNPHQAE